METKLVQRFGNSGHVVLPKEYVGKRIRFITKPKTFEDIKSEIFGILNPYLEYVLAVYLYGSYARNEQTLDSDVDILVITYTKLKIIEKISDYSIVSITLNELEDTLNKNAILILPIIKEAKTIVNPGLLEKYRELNFTVKNTKNFIDATIAILELDKKGVEMGFEIGSIIYSLMLRIRGLLMMRLIRENNLYSKSALFSFLENCGVTKEKIEELYRIYSDERKGIRVRKSSLINKEDAEKLLGIAQNLLGEIKASFK
ncbi:nucleotidyltransferase domain-containing protein [Candidatus Woesearchaeota archaeon]|nr:nucleotidyltransferase domain-containing protein [Candidatus Woesearchaeota archaeon]